MLSLFFEVLLFSLSSLKSGIVLITSFFDPPQPILTLDQWTWVSYYLLFKSIHLFKPRSLTFDNRRDTLLVSEKADTLTTDPLAKLAGVGGVNVTRGGRGLVSGRGPGVTWIYQRVSAISYRGLEHSAVCRNSVETIILSLRLTSGMCRVQYTNYLDRSCPFLYFFTLIDHLYQLDNIVIHFIFQALLFLRT